METDFFRIGVEKPIECLNRTMQYGNIVDPPVSDDVDDSLNRTMQYGNL